MANRPTSSYSVQYLWFVDLAGRTVLEYTRQPTSPHSGEGRGTLRPSSGAVAFRCRRADSTAVRRLIRRRWFVVLLVWTAFLAIPLVQLWPEATATLPPCNYHGAANQDPALPPCPPDDANYEAIGVSLLIVVWLVGVVIGTIALGISWLVRRRKERASPLPGSGPG
jgi:hypothetical protein